jgi:hypothetical protein
VVAAPPRWLPDLAWARPGWAGGRSSILVAVGSGGGGQAATSRTCSLPVATGGYGRGGLPSRPAYVSSSEVRLPGGYLHLARALGLSLDASRVMLALNGRAPRHHVAGVGAEGSRLCLCRHAWNSGRKLSSALAGPTTVTPRVPLTSLEASLMNPMSPADGVRF